ncbi:hypothetical protein TsFJ059_003924 [Trichoderma semiorbis]|uniref:Uncharacterized protein n=1 Tax=Trichoderma semiorbis TaxID=1491008 RepID=A0A9P8HWP9_9HYPO|nr:hypothetical protein TsFJ059_003924 [Trichoderma semiorbis]
MGAAKAHLQLHRCGAAGRRSSEGHSEGPREPQRVTAGHRRASEGDRALQGHGADPRAQSEPNNALCRRQDSMTWPRPSDNGAICCSLRPHRAQCRSTLPARIGAGGASGRDTAGEKGSEGPCCIQALDQDKEAIIMLVMILTLLHYDTSSRL